MLNTIGLASMWYLAAVYPFPPWYLKTVNKLIFPYIWGEGKPEFIKRQTLYLPKDQGGIAIYHPLHRSLALRTKTITQITNLNNDLKWCYIARYYIGYQLAALKPEWHALRSNSRPYHDSLRTPMYYTDVLNFVKTLPLDSVEFNTRFLYESYYKLQPYEPTAVKNWPKLRSLPYQWTNIWPLVYDSHAIGRHQEIHYKFLHLAFPTRDMRKKWTAQKNMNPHCQYCRRISSFQMENHLHAFFSCPLAYNVWAKIKPILQMMFLKDPISTLRITLGLFPPNIKYSIRKLAVSLIQITLYRVWLNYNLYAFESVIHDETGSVHWIKRTFKTLIRTRFNAFKRTNSLAKFRQEYCNTTKLLSIGDRETLVIAFT